MRVGRWCGLSRVCARTVWQKLYQSNSFRRNLSSWTRLSFCHRILYTYTPLQLLLWYINLWCIIFIIKNGVHNARIRIFLVAYNLFMCSGYLPHLFNASHQQLHSSVFTFHLLYSMHEHIYMYILLFCFWLCVCHKEDYSRISRNWPTTIGHQLFQSIIFCTTGTNLTPLNYLSPYIKWHQNIDKFYKNLFIRVKLFIVNYSVHHFCMAYNTSMRILESFLVNFIWAFKSCSLCGVGNLLHVRVNQLKVKIVDWVMVDKHSMVPSNQPDIYKIMQPKPNNAYNKTPYNVQHESKIRFFHVF